MIRRPGGCCVSSTVGSGGAPNCPAGHFARPTERRVECRRRNRRYGSPGRGDNGATPGRDRYARLRQRCPDSLPLTAGQRQRSSHSWGAPTGAIDLSNRNPLEAAVGGGVLDNQESARRRPQRTGRQPSVVEVGVRAGNRESACRELPQRTGWLNPPTPPRLRSHSHLAPLDRPSGSTSSPRRPTRQQHPPPAPAGHLAPGIPTSARLTCRRSPTHAQVRASPRSKDPSRPRPEAAGSGGQSHQR